MTLCCGRFCCFERCFGCVLSARDQAAVEFGLPAGWYRYYVADRVNLGRDVKEFNGHCRLSRWF